MALKNKSLFLYGYEITTYNSSIDFRSVALESIRMATLNLGYYSLSSLMVEISRAMRAADPARKFTVTADRTSAGGTENRITITTNGTHLELLFSSGPRLASSIAPLIGFASTDRTGATTYTGTVTSGSTLVPELTGYNYIAPMQNQQIQGSVNLSANGDKESIIFGLSKFFGVEFKKEPETKVNTYWQDLFTWMIQQRQIEFTPDVTDPNTFYVGTLERSSSDGKGLGFLMKEELPEFPFYYTTGPMTFRKIDQTAVFI